MLDVGREGFNRDAKPQPMVLATDRWKFTAASAGERAVSYSIGQSLSCAEVCLRSLCRTTGLDICLLTRGALSLCAIE